MRIRIARSQMWMRRLRRFVDEDGGLDWQYLREIPLSREVIRDGFANLLWLAVWQTIESLPAPVRMEERNALVQDGHQFLREVHRLATSTDWGFELAMDDFDRPLTPKEERLKKRERKKRPPKPQLELSLF